MVAKHGFLSEYRVPRYLLAKIHMVAKHDAENYVIADSYLLAKIHMVAKHIEMSILFLCVIF